MGPSRGAIGQKGEEEAVERCFDLRGTDSCRETEGDVAVEGEVAPSARTTVKEGYRL